MNRTKGGIHLSWYFGRFSGSIGVDTSYIRSHRYGVRLRNRLREEYRRYYIYCGWFGVDLSVKTKEA